MGRKSRLKRERRTAKMKTKKIAKFNDAEFEHTCGAIKELFRRYTVDDVLVSLNVSDLWLPNISSQVKHTLAFAILISMADDSFRGSLTIGTYSDFKKFIIHLYELLPSFPTLEDYVPELDWGEIKFQLQNSLMRIFYGGAVERISDFATAFYLIHGSEEKPCQDMHLALRAQDHVIASVDRAIIGVAENIESGHIEVPAEAFWRECRSAIYALSLRPEFADVSQGLLTKLAVLPMPKRHMDFGDAVMTGSALPPFLVEVENRRYPLALRNAAASVIQYWTSRNRVVSAETIANFISARFQNVVKGPFKVVTRTERQPHIFSTAILGEAKIYLVITLDEAEIAQLPSIEDSLKRAINSGDWALQQIGEVGAIQPRTNDNILPSFNQIVVIAVLARVNMVPGLINIPKTKARVLPLPDFVTIFDSIENIKELDRYWEFLDAYSPKIAGFSGPADCFGAFRDSNALLENGAVVPTMIGLDPNWGSTWRYQSLKRYWDNAPPLFPDVPNTEWEVERDSDGLYRSTAKNVFQYCPGVQSLAIALFTL